MRELPQLISKDSCGSSACAACGREFACGATLAGCWCAEVRLTESTRARLRELYTGCLCPACLEKFTAEKMEVSGNAEQVTGQI